MNQRLKISIVSYLNSLPLLHGLKNSDLADEIEITEDNPAQCAEKLKTGIVDIGLIPVAVLKEVENVSVFSDFCIGCDGNVDSVLLVSEEPIEKIDVILLDYQSRTSVQLVQVIAKNHWSKNFNYIQAKQGYEKEIVGTTAGVIIGDRALAARHRFKFIYDLGAEWKAMTGLPFVFAVWATTSKLEQNFIDKFNKALSTGIASIATLSANQPNSLLNQEAILDYWTRCIKYEFKDSQQVAMNKFLELINTEKS